MSARTDEIARVVLRAIEKTEQDNGTGADRLEGRMTNFKEKRRLEGTHRCSLVKTDEHSKEEKQRQRS